MQEEVSANSNQYRQNLQDKENQQEKYLLNNLYDEIQVLNMKKTNEFYFQFLILPFF